MLKNLKYLLEMTINPMHKYIFECILVYVCLSKTEACGMLVRRSLPGCHQPPGYKRRLLDLLVYSVKKEGTDLWAVLTCRVWVPMTSTSLASCPGLSREWCSPGRCLHGQTSCCPGAFQTVVSAAGEEEEGGCAPPGGDGVRGEGLKPQRFHQDKEESSKWGKEWEAVL